jgi:hypothetical protein
MKNFIKAVVIMAIFIALVKGPGPQWYQHLRKAFTGDSDQASVVPRRTKAFDYSDGDDESTGGSGSDDAQMLAAFEDNYQPAAGCDEAEGSFRTQCENHRQRTLDAFRSQWQNYYRR